MSMSVQAEDDVQVPIPELLGALLDMEGSDLHLTAGSPPVVRVHGDLERVEGYPALSPRASPKASSARGRSKLACAARASASRRSPRR